jgi:glucose-1-phosphate thymidylyltransferase
MKSLSELLKTSDFVSDLAVIGIYYFQISQYFKNELQLVLTIISFTEANNQINDGIKQMMPKA